MISDAEIKELERRIERYRDSDAVTFEALLARLRSAEEALRGFVEVRATWWAEMEREVDKARAHFAKLDAPEGKVDG